MVLWQSEGMHLASVGKDSRSYGEMRARPGGQGVGLFRHRYEAGTARGRRAERVGKSLDARGRESLHTWGIAKAMTLHDIQSAALSLPEKDRELLVHELLSSLSEEGAAEVRRLQEEEVRRRLQEVDEGRVTLVDAKEVIAELRAEFDAPR